MKKHGIIPFFIPHVGCPYICVFCNQRRITGVQQIPTPEDIEKTIQEYIEGRRSDMFWEVAFYGGSFSAIPKELQERLLAPATAALRAGDIDAIRCSTRPDAVGDEELAFLKGKGISTIELGVQSLNDTILEKAKRGHTVADVLEGSRRIIAQGIVLGIQLMPGLPGDDWGTVVQTAVKATQLGATIARIYPVLVIEDTELADMYKAGEYKPLSLDEAVSYSAFLKLWLERAGIQVIRTGLQATETFDQGIGLLGGPYDPSLGERVSNRQIWWQMESLIAEHQESWGQINKIVVSYPRAYTSKVRGVKNEMKISLEKKYATVQWMWQELVDTSRTEEALKALYIYIDNTKYIVLL